MGTATEKQYRRITAKIASADDGSVIELIVDPSKHEDASWDGAYHPAIDIGYGRPMVARLPIGHISENIVLTDSAVEFIPVWRIADLESKPQAQLAEPLLRSQHPTRYTVIAGAWTGQDQGVPPRRAR